jgi:hypothetical protein
MPPSLPPERALLSSYKLWRKHVDPDGLVSASEFAEMDEDEKRDALRELGGPVAAAAADDEDDDEHEDEDEEDELPPLDLAEGDDPLSGDTVELTEDVIDPRTADPFS